jgi:hypothetical protein
MVQTGHFIDAAEECSSTRQIGHRRSALAETVRRVGKDKVTMAMRQNIDSIDSGTATVCQILGLKDRPEAKNVARAVGVENPDPR